MTEFNNVDLNRLPWHARLSVARVFLRALSTLLRHGRIDLEITKHMTEWTREWPKQPGWYWFYGWRSYFSKHNSKPELIMVRVHKIANGVSYVGDGQFMYQAEGGEGFFCKAETPATP